MNLLLEDLADETFEIKNGKGEVADLNNFMADLNAKVGELLPNIKTFEDEIEHFDLPEASTNRARGLACASRRPSTT